MKAGCVEHNKHFMVLCLAKYFHSFCTNVNCGLMTTYSKMWLRPKQSQQGFLSNIADKNYNVIESTSPKAVTQCFSRLPFTQYNFLSVLRIFAFVHSYIPGKHFRCSIVLLLYNILYVYILDFFVHTLYRRLIIAAYHLVSRNEA